MSKNNVTQLRKDPASEEPKPNPGNPPIPKDEASQENNAKPNVFKRIGHGIVTGFRKVRESPVATVIGAVIATGLTIGATYYLSHRSHGESDDGDGMIPNTEDPIEIEDGGETYVSDEMDD